MGIHIWSEAKCRVAEYVDNKVFVKLHKKDYCKSIIERIMASIAEPAHPNTHPPTLRLHHDLAF